MAIAITARASAEMSPSSASPVETGAFTPAGNALLVAVFWAIDDGLDARINETISDSLGGVWTKRISGGNHADAYNGLHLWTRPVTTGALMTVAANITSGGMHAKQLHILEITGHDSAAPIGAAVAVADIGNTTGAMALPSAPAASSVVLAARCLAVDDGQTASATPGSGWSEHYDLTSPDRGGLQTQSRFGSTSTAIAWGAVNAGGAANLGCSGMAIEVKAAGVPTTRVSTSAVFLF